MKQTHLLFTYGTMLSGIYNNGRIQGSTLLGKAETCEPYAMVGKRYPRQIPYVDRAPEGHAMHRYATNIQGEVYKLDDATLAIVDRAEGHPFVYKREYVWVRLANGVTVRAIMYLHPVGFKYGMPVPSGNFRDFYKPVVHKQQGHFEGQHWGRLAV